VRLVYNEADVSTSSCAAQSRQVSQSKHAGKHACLELLLGCLALMQAGVPACDSAQGRQQGGETRRADKAQRRARCGRAWLPMAPMLSLSGRMHLRSARLAAATSRHSCAWCSSDRSITSCAPADVLH